MTVERTPSVGYSNRPYAYALIGVVLLIVVAWLNQDRVQPVTAGTVAPEFEVNDLEGGLARLSDHRGEVVLVNIWATWCLPCRVEMPSMERLYQEIGEDGFEIMAVSIDAVLGQFDQAGRPGGDIEVFADSLGLTFPHAPRSLRGDRASIPHDGCAGDVLDRQGRNNLQEGGGRDRVGRAPAQGADPAFTGCSQVIPSPHRRTG